VGTSQITKPNPEDVELESVDDREHG